MIVHGTFLRLLLINKKLARFSLLHFSDIHTPPLPSFTTYYWNAFFDTIFSLIAEVSKLRADASAMLETSRMEEASLRRLLETASLEGRRLVKALSSAEAARDAALAVGKGAGGEAKGLREQLAKEMDEHEAFQRGATAELASKVRGGEE